MRKQKNRPSNTGQLVRAASALSLCVIEFAEEFGDLVLCGASLPPRAAEELAGMIRCSHEIRRLAAGRAGISRKASNSKRGSRVK
jgi:hypothetical protein